MESADRASEPAQTPAPAPATPDRSSSGGSTSAPLRVQARLQVGATNDPLEREADVVAGEVVELLQRSADGFVAPTDMADTRIRRSAPTGAAGGPVDAETESKIKSARGRPLPNDVQRSMSNAMGADFGRVRVHDDARSAELNRRVGAEAFTLGSDVFLSRKVDGSTRSGQKLLAHELTHVVQQGGAGKIRRTEAAPGAVPPATAPPVEEPAATPEPEPASSTPPTDATEELPTEGAVEDGEEVEEPAHIKGPYDKARDVSSTRASSPPQNRVPVNVVLDGFTTTASNDLAAASSKDDDVASTVSKVAWSNPGGKKVKAFGSESFVPSYSGVRWKQSKDGGPITVSFKLKVKCPWGVKTGGQKDISSAKSRHVKADTYQQVVADLTPKLVEKSWRAPRSQYWSKAICARHEKFHSTDDRDWAKAAGKDRMTNFIDTQGLDLSADERKSKRTVSRKVKALLAAAVSDLGTANFEFYTGGAGSYCSYAGEERAFGDGKQPYIDLADGVKKRGEELAAKAQKKSAKKAAKASPASGT